MHRGWSIEGATALTRPSVLLARYAETVPGAYVPDLSASRLSLVPIVVAQREKTLRVANARDLRVQNPFSVFVTGLTG